jgi:hypothetical protein
MRLITITEKENNVNNLTYVQSGGMELFKHADCKVESYKTDDRAVLSIKCPDKYIDIVKSEIVDKVAEIIVIKYKYDYLKKTVFVSGLNFADKEILIASLIAADLDDDKRYAFDRLKQYSEIAIDGTFNFRLKALKKKWHDVVGYIPVSFVRTQLKEFISFLIESKKKRIYVEGGQVYDSHFRRLKRSTLLGENDASVIKEVLLSNCGEIELSGEISKDDEYYLREFYGDKIIFSTTGLN